MVDIPHQKPTKFRWFCVNKDRCEELDAQIDEISTHAAHLSSYVAEKFITGLECLVLDSRLKLALTELRKERASLWRRVKREIKEEVAVEEAPKPLIAIQHIGRLDTQ